MPIQIGQKPESDFSNPLGLLSDCHRRIEHFLGILIKICDRFQGEPIPAVERPALEKSLAYFREAAPRHTADEEESLFPRLRAAAQAEATLADLEGDHQTANRDHELVDTLGSEWLRDGMLRHNQLLEMRQALDRLSGLYQRHIAIEDRDLFPLAALVLPANELAEVGREMANRRKSV